MFGLQRQSAKKQGSDEQINRNLGNAACRQSDFADAHHAYLDSDYYDLDTHQADSGNAYSYDPMLWAAYPLSQILRSYREYCQKSLYQAADDLRIRAAYLDALENGAYHALPGVTYASGFVRTYASYLGLPPEEMVERFRREARGDMQPVAKVQPTKVAAAIAAQAKMPSNSKAPRGLALVGVLLLLVGGFVGYLFINPDTTVVRMDASGRTIIIGPDGNEETLVASGGLTSGLPLDNRFDGLEVDNETELMELMNIQPEARDSWSSGPADSTLINGLADLDVVSAAPSAVADVMIQAKALQWVEIRDLRDQVVDTQVLEPGMQMTVPRQPNLRLSVYGAEAMGDLEVFVDGKHVPNLLALDADGRTYSLDATALRSAAVQE